MGVPPSSIASPSRTGYPKAVESTATQSLHTDWLHSPAASPAYAFAHALDGGRGNGYQAAFKRRQVELLRRAWEAFDRGDLGEATEVRNPAVRWYAAEGPTARPALTTATTRSRSSSAPSLTV